jgi:hypothetical protein
MGMVTPSSLEVAGTDVSGDRDLGERAQDDVRWSWRTTASLDVLSNGSIREMTDSATIVGHL